MGAKTRELPALSWNGALVLQAMTQGHGYGFEIMGVTSLPSGSVYPLLRRLEAAGLVCSQWEDEEGAHAEGRPARRYYEALDRGREALAAARERIAIQQQLFGTVVSEA